MPAQIDLAARPGAGREGGRGLQREGTEALADTTLADRDPFPHAALECALPACPGAAPGGDARGDVVAARPPTLPPDGRSVRGGRNVKLREQRQQDDESQSARPSQHPMISWSFLE